MPPDMAISMRHTKLTASEAAVLAGEVQKPGWESKNEGIHERVSFEDAIWGFDLAGGSYYQTPLRVVGVKPGSRAEKAGIRPGDRLKRINDIETSTLTIQEAHAIIIESGVHLKLAVTAPEDEEDAYFCYQDPVDTGYDSDEERRREEERARKREVHAKVSSYWSLQWPWVSKRRIIYRESNCFMVPSKFEGKNRSKFPEQPMIRTQVDQVVLNNATNGKEIPEVTKNDILQNELPKTNPITNDQVPMTNGVDLKESLTNGAQSNVKQNSVMALPEISENEEESILEDTSLASEVEENGHLKPEKEEESIQEDTSLASEVEENGHIQTEKEEESIHEEILEEEEVSELYSEIEEKSQVETSEATENHEEVVTSEASDIHDEVINEILESHNITKEEEDQVLDDILSDSEANSTNER